MGADVILDPQDLDKSFAPGRNFCTKLWNIGRFLLTNVGTDPVRPLAELAPERLTRADRWILARLDRAIADCDAALGPSRPDGSWALHERFAGLRLNEYAEAARRFAWDELAAWYLESTKGRIGGTAVNTQDAEIARSVLVHVFDQALRLLSPIVPFVTEALWQRLPGRGADEYLVSAAWPTQAGYADDAAAAEFELVCAAAGGIRQVRSDYAVAPSKPVEATIVAPAGGDARRVFEEEAELIGRLTRATVTAADAAPAGAAAHVVLGGGADLVVPLGGLVDLAKERAKLEKELGEVEKQLTGARARLANEKFVASAPAQVIEGARTSERQLSERRDQLVGKLAALSGQ
jgi:valyl-tRNA synthetase